MGNVMFMRKGEVHTAPMGGLPVSSLVEGQIVMINENGTPVPFYLAKHDYESGLNGAGRTLLVRQYGTEGDTMYWNDSTVNAYVDSTIDKWFLETYALRLDTSLLSAIGETKIRYTPGNGDNTVSTLSRSIFALSVTELGITTGATSANVEGEILPVADLLKVIKYIVSSSGNYSTSYQWTRTPDTSGKTNVYRAQLATAGSVASLATNAYRSHSRPAFTIPSTMCVDLEPNEDGSVNLMV